MHRRFREYDPATGQFTHEDPIGLAGGANLYGFANGDPVNFGDPFGLCPPCGADAIEVFRTLGRMAPAMNQALTEFLPKNALAAVTGNIVGGIVGRIAGAAASRAASGVSNPVPTVLARAVRADVTATQLGEAGAVDVFVTDANAIRGISNSAELARRLGVPRPAAGFQVFEFPTSSVGPIASPIRRLNPGFVGRGLTRGGAPEFVIPQQAIPSSAVRRTVP